MSNAVFLLTRFKDGGVRVQHPARECIRALMSGGYYGRVSLGFIDKQIERQIKDGRRPDAAARFTNALIYGCGTERRAVEILRDRDCAHVGFNIELIDLDELPDRWFRDAWSRSTNGGPVSIDLKAARRIQWRKIREAVCDERLFRSLNLVALPPLKVERLELQKGIEAARDEDELAGVWPDGVARFGRDCNGFEMSAPSAKLRERFNKGAPQ